MEMKNEFAVAFNIFLLVAGILLSCFIIFFFICYKSKKKTYRITILLKSISTIIIAFLLKYFISGLFRMLGIDGSYDEVTTILVSLILAFFIFLLFQQGMSEQVDEVTDKIEKKYKDYSAYTTLYFEHLFGMNNSIEKEFVFRNVLNNHKKLAESQEYLITFNSYLDIVVNFLNQGYELVSVNSTLIPYWYAPTNFEVSATRTYIKSLKNYKSRVTRLTYYDSDGLNDSKEWWEDAVKKIFEDLADGEKGGKEYAIKWIATLYRAIEKEPDDQEVRLLMGLQEDNKVKGYTFLEGDFECIKQTANDENRWEKVLKYVRDNSKELTTFIISQYEKEMGTAHHCTADIFRNKFIDDNPMEIGLFKKGKDCPLTVLLLGNVSQAVIIKVITDKKKNEEYEKKIKELLNDSKHG